MYDIEGNDVIVNCDEGDPGAFMNRALMEGNPHSVLEGLTIGAYAMGLTKALFMCARNILWLRITLLLL
jgi:NADH:ubiquinone oxidoreductase subunit F (NADH-binding)